MIFETVDVPGYDEPIAVDREVYLAAKLQLNAERSVNRISPDWVKAAVKIGQEMFEPGK